MNAKNIYKQNLNYLKQHIPQLFEVIQKESIENITIDINHFGINIIKNNEKIYQENCSEFLASKIEQFFNKPTAFYRDAAITKKHLDISPISDFYLTTIENKIPVPQNDKSSYDTHLDSIPILLLVGIGTGQEIEQLINSVDIKTLIIIDENFSMLKSSMHIIDWRAIFQYFSRESYSLEFKISQNTKPLSMNILNFIFQNNLYYSNYIPYFSSYKTKFIEEIIYHLNKNYNLLFNGWGFYDDEIISLTHTISNINNHQPFFLNNQLVPSKSNIFIIGSGPSLDKDIENIKKHQNCAILISCGTALIPLEANGIIPDYHIEIERPKSTYTRLLQFSSKEFMKKINFIGLNVIYPETFDLFKTSKIFFRTTDCGSSIVSNIPKLNHCNPTVVNGALSFASAIGFEKVFLFGTDMGYEDENTHHSKYNVYIDKSTSYYGWKPTTVDILFPKNFDKTTKIFSSDILFWAKQRVENCIKDYKIKKNKNIEYYNCSDGVFIEETIALKSNKINIAQDKDNILNIIEANFTKEYKKIQINFEQEKTTSINTIDILLNILNNTKNISSFSQFFEIMDKTYKIINSKKDSIIYSLLSGTIALIYKTIYTHSLQAKHIDNSFIFINQGFLTTIEFLNKVKNDLHEYSIK